MKVTSYPQKLTNKKLEHVFLPENTIANFFRTEKNEGYI